MFVVSVAYFESLQVRNKWKQTKTRIKYKFSHNWQGNMHKKMNFHSASFASILYNKYFPTNTVHTKSVPLSLILMACMQNKIQG